MIDRGKICEAITLLKRNQSARSNIEGYEKASENQRTESESDILNLDLNAVSDVNMSNYLFLVSKYNQITSLGVESEGEEINGY